jgi:acetyl-CoA synthetase
VTQFYTAPTATCSSKRKCEICPKHHLTSNVGEPINEEAWHWYNDHVGQKMSGVDTWWQTETGGIMISPIAFVTLLNQLMQLYRYRIQPVLMDENRNEIEGNQVGKFVY